jgi:hypothetical protein
MADETTTPSVPAPDTGFTDPPATPTAAELAAKDFITGFRDLAKRLPKVESPHPTTVVSVRGRLNVPASFAQTVAEQVELTPDLQALNSYDVEGTKRDIQQVAALKPVLQELQNFVKALKFTVDGKQVKANNASLRMYAMARALARDPQFAHVGVVADTLDAAKRPKKRQTASQAGQQPQNGGPIVQTTTTTTPTH